ncbi:MAG TPA: hypothetical protein VF527_04315, partial [Pyrinomonadaceae bacterium]
MLKCLLACCLCLAYVPLSFSQQPTPNNEQLLNERVGHALISLSDNIKKIEEPAFRVFLRTRLAKFLWGKGASDAAGKAEVIAAEAVTDFQAHQAGMPPLSAGLFRKELLAVLQLHAPKLAAELTKEGGTVKPPDDLSMANDLLTGKDGSAKAIEIVRRSIQQTDGTTVSRINSFFKRLDEIQPSETTRLLGEVMSAAENEPNGYSVTSLFILANNYLHRSSTPRELTARFLTVLIKKTNNGAALPPQEQMYAYNLLKFALPVVQNLIPSLYAQAGVQMTNLASLRTGDNHDDVDARIRDSRNPLEQMITEAKATNNAVLKKRLLARAAEMALEQGKLELALEIISSMEIADKEYRDQFLAQVVSAAVKQKNLTLADAAASKIDSKLRRAFVMQSIALYVFGSEDPGSAGERLVDAAELINATDNDIEKATALFRSIPVVSKIDKQMALETIGAAVKVVNNLPVSRSAEKP